MPCALAAQRRQEACDSLCTMPVMQANSAPHHLPPLLFPWTPDTVKQDAGKQMPPQGPWQRRHSEAGGWAASGYILSKIARGYTLQSQFIFKRALCYPMVCLFFLYNRTTFENYISCNDLILLIAIQEKKFPPSQQPSRENLIKVLTRGQSNMASTLVETKSKKMRRKQID